jgi:hypothetical protein
MSTDFDFEIAKKDIKFLLSFTPGLDVVPEGLMSMFYVTGTYEGDVKLVEKLQEIANRYDITEIPSWGEK